MKTLVIAEHDNGALKPETSKTINAAVKIGFPVDVLIAGIKPKRNELSKWPALMA